MRVGNDKQLNRQFRSIIKMIGKRINQNLLTGLIRRILRIPKRFMTFHYYRETG